MSLRLFIAIRPPEEIIQEIINYQRKNLNHSAFRLIEKENIHLTLIFLGYINEELISKIIEVCERISRQYQPFSVNFSLFDYGPNQKFPRLIWLEGKAEKELLLLKENLENELLKNKISFKKEDRDFKAHITIARIKKDFKGTLPSRKIINQKTNLSFEANSFLLMKSKLTPRGAQYHQLKHFLFKK